MRFSPRAPTRHSSSNAITVLSSSYNNPAYRRSILALNDLLEHLIRTFDLRQLEPAATRGRTAPGQSRGATGRNMLRSLRH